MILLKYFSRSSFTQSPIMGIPTFDMWFHMAQGTHWKKILDIKYPFVLMMPTAKLKFPMATLNIFIQPQRKV